MTENKQLSSECPSPAALGVQLGSRKQRCLQGRYRYSDGVGHGPPGAKTVNSENLPVRGTFLTQFTPGFRLC